VESWVSEFLAVCGKQKIWTDREETAWMCVSWGREKKGEFFSPSGTGNVNEMVKLNKREETDWEKWKSSGGRGDRIVIDCPGLGFARKGGMRGGQKVGGRRAVRKRSSTDKTLKAERQKRR